MRTFAGHYIQVKTDVSTQNTKEKEDTAQAQVKMRKSLLPKSYLCSARAQGKSHWSEVEEGNWLDSTLTNHGQELTRNSNRMACFIFVSFSNTSERINIVIH